MRLFYTKRYDIYNDKRIKILVLSDIHFSSSIKDKKLDIITKYIKNELPDYLLIPGDLIDCVDEITNIYNKDRLIKWITEISKLTCVLISLGNHDMFKRINKTKILINK